MTFTLLFSLLWITYFGKVSFHVIRTFSQPCGEVYMGRTATFHQQSMPTCQASEWATLGADLSTFAKPSDNCSHSPHHDCSVIGDSEPELHRQATSDFLTHRNCEIICVYHFKSLYFGVTCYAAIANQYSMPWYISVFLFSLPSAPTSDIWEGRVWGQHLWKGKGMLRAVDTDVSLYRRGNRTFLLGWFGFLCT